jgi:hypothetical protein
LVLHIANEWDHWIVRYDHPTRPRLRGAALALAGLTVACFNSDIRNIVGEIGSSTPLAEGVQQVDVSFEVVDPRTHRFWVEVTMPIGTELQIDFVDPNGGFVRVLDRSIVPNCDESGDNLVCSLPPLNLGGHPPGSWNTTILKTSEPAAIVEITTMVELTSP